MWVAVAAGMPRNVDDVFDSDRQALQGAGCLLLRLLEDGHHRVELSAQPVSAFAGCQSDGIRQLQLPGLVDVLEVVIAQRGDMEVMHLVTGSVGERRVVQVRQECIFSCDLLQFLVQGRALCQICLLLRLFVDGNRFRIIVERAGRVGTASRINGKRGPLVRIRDVHSRGREDHVEVGIDVGLECCGRFELLDLDRNADLFELGFHDLSDGRPLVDMHAGDIPESLEPFSMFEESEVEQVSRDLAVSYGLGHVMRQSDAARTISGSSCAAAADVGIPAIIAESGQNGLLDRVAIDIHLAGLTNLARRIGVLDGEPEPEREVRHYDGWHWLRTEKEGWWQPAVGPGASVAAGEMLGTMSDVWGDVFSEVRAPETGTVLFLTSSPAVLADGLLMGLARG